ncbi:Uncharacterised protein [Mycobacterium tuberculosis]|uniref:Uncharacterized protein n=1 Tax=Mycobacterium tuberculosis TaxID=1773 RepID=A0A916LFW0_MYCTX|nr:Uncharacterised protein [Mycobacterium tuberculosis]
MVDHQAGAAEPVQTLQLGKYGRAVELQGPTELVWHHFEPGGAHACPLMRRVVAVQQGDVPFLDPGTTGEHQRGAVADGCHPLDAGAHRLQGLPGAGGDAPAGLPVDQQRHPDTPVDLLQSGHDDVTNMRDSNVDRQRLRLNGG